MFGGGKILSITRLYFMYFRSCVQERITCFRYEGKKNQVFVICTFAKVRTFSRKAKILVILHFTFSPNDLPFRNNLKMSRESFCMFRKNCFSAASISTYIIVQCASKPDIALFA